MAQQRATGPALPLDLTILVSPAAQTSTNAHAAVTGSVIDTHTVGASSVAYRIQVATNTLLAKIQGSLDGTNWKDLKCFSLDGLAQDSAAEQTVTAGAGNALERHVGALSGYRYYRVSIDSAADDAFGAATVTGFAKAGLSGQSVSATSVTIGAALPAGTNNLGDVDILSIAAGDTNIGNVDIASAIPAGTNLIGKVSANTATVAPAAQASTNAYADIAGSTIDTLGLHARIARYTITESGAANGITCKLVGSLDDATYYDLTAQTEAGADQAGVDVAIAANGTGHFVVSASTAKGSANRGMRYLKAQLKATVGGSQGQATLLAVAY